MSDYDNDTRQLLLEKIMMYQHDLICCYEHIEDTPSQNNRIKQDKAIITELKNIWYGQNSDGLVFIE